MVAGMFCGTMGYLAWHDGHEHPQRAVGYGLASLGAAAYLVYTCMASRHAEAGEGGGMTRLQLRGQPLDDVIRSFCGRDTPAARFDWLAPEVFVDDLRIDQSEEVSHLLARAFRLTKDNPALIPALQNFANQLASQPDLRQQLAATVRDANASCDDRLGVSIGRLMLSGVLHQLRDPATPPSDVVHVLTLHAATRAIHTRIFELLAEPARPRPPYTRIFGRRAEPARPEPPSAELLLMGAHAVQSGLRQAGLAVPEVFPKRLYLVADVRRHQHRVEADALQIARSFAGPGGGANLVGLLQAHGGKEVDEVLSARLYHHLEPLRERLIADQPQGRDDQGLAAAQWLQHAYKTARDELFMRAVEGALCGTGDLWVPPAATGPAPGDTSAASSPASPAH